MDKEERDKRIEAIIDKFGMDKGTLSRDEVRERVVRSMVYNNLLYVLMDTCNTFLMDMEEELKPLGTGMGNKDKAQFERAYARVKDACRATEKFTMPMYHTSESDDACADSDWWRSFILLVNDRTGDDRRKTNLLLEFILNMPTELGLFKITYNDFKRLMK